MQVVRTIQEMLHIRAQWSGSVGFVPTMGYLHEGHLSLFRRARKENQLLVGSIFVNPTQFGPHEDLSRYPRDLERDLQLLESVGVDIVFTPSAAEMYPSGFSTYILPEGPLSQQGEGASRPGHFRGVATIVMKLFQLIRPDIAYFGQKDAQQVVVIAQMIRDFHLPVKLCIGPTIREHDGLAMSSRNSYLDTASREAAPVLYQALQAGRAAFHDPSSDPKKVVQVMMDVVAREPRASLDYAEVRDATTFLPVKVLRAPALLLLAVWIGQTRLIDNFVLREDGNWDAGQFVS